MFRPLFDNHAVREVVFLLVFDRPFSEAQLGALEKLHPSFRKELPKSTRQDVFQIGLGPALPQPSPVRPLIFSAHKRDGSIDWQLQAVDNMVTVNCATYTRWTDVSNRALLLLQNALAPLMMQQNCGVASIGLQYIDEFDWEGSADKVDIGLLLSKETKYLPRSVWENVRLPFWHLHQGWFRMEGQDRVLERLHIDALQNGPKHVVNFEVLTRLDFAAPRRKRSELFFDDGGLAVELFEKFHTSNKAFMLDILNRELAAKIGLTGE